jgi:hypothetical protein
VDKNLCLFKTYNSTSKTKTQKMISGHLGRHLITRFVSISYIAFGKTDIISGHEKGLLLGKVRKAETALTALVTSAFSPK